MKKMLMLVASVAMAVAMTGCGGSKKSAEEQEKKATADAGSPKTVAEDFVKAIIQKEPGKALEFYDTVEETRGDNFALRTKKEKDNLKMALEDLGKKINDDKYNAKTILEQVRVPPEIIGHMLVNGKKYTGETATVTVQYVKGDDKKQDGLVVSLVKVDGSWKVTGYNPVSGLDTDDSDREAKSDREDKPYRESKRDGGNRKFSAVADGDRDGERDRVREYERLCRQYVSLLRKEGQDIPEEEIEKEVEKFKKYSRSRQEEELEQAEEQLRKMRRSADRTKAGSRKYEYEDKKPAYPTSAATATNAAPASAWK